LDTHDFLSHILPQQGVKFIVFVEPDQPWIHKPAEHVAVAADIATQADTAGRTVYHACATFKEPFVLSETETYSNGKPRKKYREHTNAGWVKSLWIDLDCGDGKDYPDQKTALADVVRFCKESGLPRPLLVNSGYGVHCYWVFDSEIGADMWKRVAGIWRCVLDHFKVKHDSNCTADVSRVLRPVGKHGGKKLVKLIGAVPPTVPPKKMIEMLTALVKQHGISVKQQTYTAKPKIDNSDLGGGMEHPPSSAYKLVDHCLQVREFRDAGGDVPEPLWYAMLGLLKHTAENHAVCHEWSKDHPDYDPVATENKIIQWVHGPTLCAKIEALNPGKCDGCVHKGKIKSPIQLGTVVPEPVEIAEVNDTTGEPEVLPKIPQRMRERFAWTGSHLCIFTRTEDGVLEPMPFSSMFLFPRQYSRNMANKMDMTWVLRERPGKYREFELPGEVIGVGGRDLSAKLGQQGVVCSPGGKKAMEQYITEWFNDMRTSADEVSAYTAFGWNREGFLLGDTLFKADGSEQRVRVQGDAERYVPAFATKGTLQGWVDRVEQLYNRPGHEQFQWMMGTAFGAPLVKFLGGPTAGCIVNGYSSESGLGKSTAGMVGLAAYGDPGRLMLTKNQATAKGLFAYIGVMNSLPILLDEVTNTKGYEFSDMVYTFSEGVGRIGALSDGTLRSNVYSWRTLMATTSNRAIHSTLAAAKIDATPEISRVFEYRFNRNLNQMPKVEADEVIPALLENCGHAGRVFLAYVVRNEDKVKQLLAKTRRMLTEKGRMASSERYWLTGMTATMTGLIIAKALKLVDFDLNALMNWSLAQVRNMRDTVVESATDAMEQFGVMLNEMAGGFLVTDKEGDARSGETKAMILRAPRSDLVGRVVIGTNRLYLPVSAVRRWCSENQADYRDMTSKLVENMWASVDTKPMSLGRGTNEFATAPSRCYIIDLSKVSGMFAEDKNPVNIRAVK
jgi:hypothetical protein